MVQRFLADSKVSKIGPTLLQNLYQHLLVKKLAETCFGFGGQNGDHTLCLLKRLVMDYTQLFGRFNIEIKKDMQKVTLLKE